MTCWPCLRNLGFLWEDYQRFPQLAKGGRAVAVEKRFVNLLFEVAEKRADLPRVLARAVRKGRVKEALRLLEDWGYGRRPLSDLYSEAVALVADGGDSGEGG